MAELTQTYSLGDKVVHRSYGVGQIDGIEHRPLNGVKVECFKVKTANGAYWFPTNRTDNPRIHPLASKAMLRRAIDILRSAPHDLELDPFLWKDRVDEVLSNGDFLAICRLVRDLAALKTVKKSTRILDQAFNSLEERLINEWAASQEVEAKTVRPKLEACLRESHHNIQETT